MRRTRAVVLGAFSYIACFVDQAPSSSEGDGTTGPSSTSTSEASPPSSESSGECACAPEEPCIDGTCVPLDCGDGIVGPDEECDEGSANAQNGACKLDCTLQVCGDGVMGAMEACDDGNLVQGDGCNVDCQPSGAIVWEHLHDGAVGGEDVANDVVVFPGTGDVVVVGAVVDEGDTASAWYRVLDPDGGVRLTSPTTVSDEGSARLFGVVCDPTECIAVGHQEHPNQLFGAIVRVFGPDGTRDQTFELENELGTGRLGYDVALAPEGVDIVGSSQNGFIDHDGVLEELDDAFAPTNAYVLLSGLGIAVLRRIQRVGDRRFVVGWSVAEDDTFVRAYLLIANDDGSLANTIPVEGSEFMTAASLAVDPSGDAVVVVGNRSGVMLTDGPGSAVLRRYATDGTPQWENDDAYGGHNARFEDVALTPDGDIVAVGAVRAKGGTDDILVARHGPDGEQRWTRVISDAGFDHAYAVAIDPQTEAIVVAGRRTVDGSEDAWVARLTP